MTKIYENHTNEYAFKKYLNTYSIEREGYVFLYDRGVFFIAWRKVLKSNWWFGKDKVYYRIRARIHLEEAYISLYSYSEYASWEFKQFVESVDPLKDYPLRLCCDNHEDHPFDTTCDKGFYRINYVHPFSLGF